MVVWAVALPAFAYGGWWLEDSGTANLVGTRPFSGEWIQPEGIEILARVAPSIAFAALAVWLLPLAARRLGWWTLLATSWAVAAVWAWVLTLARGPMDFLRPLLRDDDYLTALPQPDMFGFLQAFTDNLLGYATHVQGHPPGLVVLLSGADSVGLAHPVVVAVMYVVIGTSAIIAAAVTVRVLADDEHLARKMLPAAVLAPAAVWIATSPDAFFAGVLAWGVALLAVASARAARGEGPQRWWWGALGAGVLLGLCPFLSYGLLPMGLVVVAVVWVTRAWRVFFLVGGLVVVQALLWAAAGFWIVDGIAATANAWELDMASVRPYWYFLFANLVVLATVVGPATLASLPLARRLGAPTSLFIGFAVAAAIAGSALGWMRGEVERIWLPLTPWILLACAVVGWRRIWLATQATVAIGAATLIESPW